MTTLHHQHVFGPLGRLPSLLLVVWCTQPKDAGGQSNLELLSRGAGVKWGVARECSFPFLHPWRKTALGDWTAPGVCMFPTHNHDAKGRSVVCAHK